MKTRLMMVAAAVLLWHLPAAAAALDDAQYAALAARFQAAVDAERVRYSVPGITAAFVLSDGRTVKVASGFADVERKLAMTPDSRMLGGSTGKTLAAAVAMKLAEQGTWSLDDKVSKYLGKRPWFARLPNADALTIRLLLQHRSGLENYYNNPRFLDWYRERMAADPSFVPGFDTLIEFVCDQRPLFAPGQGFNYSDIGYLLVGLAIESATGRAYYDLAREFFLDPLGLTLTVPANTRRILTAGGFATNAGDLARWAFDLYGGRALDARTLSDMVAVPTGVTTARYYGLGAGVFPAADGLPLAYGHDGYIPGYRSSMRYYPAAAVAIALQVNTEDGYWEEGTGKAAGHLDFASVRARLNRIVLQAAGAGR
jgi:D-alanyl-D-alanine carboxypeptidase